MRSETARSSPTTLWSDAEPERMIASHLEKMNKVFSGVKPEEREEFLRLLEDMDRQLEE